MTVNDSNICFKLTSPGAQLPKKGRPGDIAYDIYASEDITVYSKKTRKVPTGLVLAHMPTQDNYFIKIEGRSGLALRGIFPVGGIVDPNYRGEIGIILTNQSPERFEIKAGDRIAQMIIYKVADDTTLPLVEVDEVQETERGAGGFGSSGR